MTDANKVAPNVVAPVETKDEKPVINDVAQRLSQSTVSEVKQTEDKPVQAPSMLVDLANLTSDQLQVLKSMLNVTPDQVHQKKGNIKIEIRRMMVEDKERFVVDMERARRALAFDATLQKDVETLKMRVKLDGDKGWTDMEYRDFMQLDRVTVEVIAQRQEESITKEGQVRQAETGRIVEKEVKNIVYWYTVKLPNGSKIELEGKMANA
jgi:hypothetical protein